MGTNKIKTFKDLIAWKEGHLLVLEIYKITENFPKSEIFGLTNQMRRAAVSITSNIAEGFSRRTAKEKIQFYRTSLGSLTEIQNQLIVSKDLKYITNDLYEAIDQKTTIIHKLINGLVKSSKSYT